MAEFLAKRGAGKITPPEAWAGPSWIGPHASRSTASVSGSREACMRLVEAGEVVAGGGRGKRAGVYGKRRSTAGSRAHSDEAVLKRPRIVEGEGEVDSRGADALPVAAKPEEVVLGGGGAEERPPEALRLDGQGGRGEAGGGTVQGAHEQAGTVEGGAGVAMRGGLIDVGRGHHIARTGGVIWCRRCGGHAEARIGIVLAGACTPIQKGEKSGRAYRRRLLLRRRHPITKEALEEDEAKARRRRFGEEEEETERR